MNNQDRLTHLLSERAKVPPTQFVDIFKNWGISNSAGWAWINRHAKDKIELIDHDAIDNQRWGEYLAKSKMGITDVRIAKDFGMSTRNLRRLKKKMKKSS